MAGVRKSSILLSNLVSWFTRIFNAVSSTSPTGLAASSICRGSCAFAALTTNTSSRCTSTSFCVHDSIFDGTDFTVAFTSTIDSFVMLNATRINKDCRYHSFKLTLTNLPNLLGYEFNHLLADRLIHSGQSLDRVRLLPQHDEALFACSTNPIIIDENDISRMKQERNEKYFLRSNIVYLSHDWYVNDLLTKPSDSLGFCPDP